MSLPAIKFYAAVATDGYFSIPDLCRKKSAVVVSRSDLQYGDVTVKTVRMTVLNEATASCGNSVKGWIVKNPDDTFWLDTLSESENDAQSWMEGNKDRMLSLGFKTVPVEFKLAN